jgi:hypothetical protein
MLSGLVDVPLAYLYFRLYCLVNKTVIMNFSSKSSLIKTEKNPFYSSYTLNLGFKLHQITPGMPMFML